MRKTAYLNTIIGLIAIVEENDYIIEIFISKKGEEKEETSLLLKEAKKQLSLYFAKQLREFDLPINFKGTSFEKKVYEQLIKIPYGKSKSYKDIAKLINNEKSFRAVGNAVGKNPLLIIIPCHRVIKSDGSLGGFSSGIENKKTLISLEKEKVN